MDENINHGSKRNLKIILMQNRNLYYYNNIIRLNLLEKFNLEENPSSLITSLENIVITGTIKKTPAHFESKIKNVLYGLETVYGQKPQLLKARKSVAAFQVRKDSISAWKITLRKNALFDFLDKLTIDAMPRARDFEGFRVKKGNNATIAIGLKTYNIFSDIDIQYSRFRTSFGSHLIFNTQKSTNKYMNIALLRSFSIPVQYK
jgi:large subunit ribosomal protein L5